MAKHKISKKFWSPLVNELSPYHPGEQPTQDNYIKLNTNEHPYSPSPKVRKAMIKMLEINGEKLKLYPDPENTELRKAIASYFKVEIDQVFVGNGSDEVLAFVFQTLFSKRGLLVFPEITYSFYPSLAKLFGIKTKTLKIKDNFKIDLEKIDRTAKSVIFANPNATTGLFLQVKKIEQFLSSNPNKLLVVDEAYVDFGCSSCVPLTKKYSNLLVVQTFSKSRALAGMRLGFAIGNLSLIEALNRTKNSFNTYPIDRLASEAGINSIKDHSWFEINKIRVMKNRDFLTENLKKIGFKVIKSKANFILTSHKQVEAYQIFNKLKKNKILVRHFKDKKIKDWVRISIGTKTECLKLLRVLKNILKD